MTRLGDTNRLDEGKPQTTHVLVVLFAGPLAMAYGSLRFWLDGERMPGWFALVTAAICTWIAWAALLRRRWVEVSAAGFSFREGRRRRRFRWTQVESFDLGNPADPVHAYVRLKSGEVIRLPKFLSVDPEGLVELLSERRPP